MSTNKGIQKVERGDRVAVIDVETGAAGTGDTYPEALEDLASILRAIEDLAETASELEELADATSDVERAGDVLADMENTAEFIDLATRTQERFEDGDIDEETVDEAIEWARSR